MYPGELEALRAFAGDGDGIMFALNLGIDQNLTQLDPFTVFQAVVAMGAMGKICPVKAVVGQGCADGSFHLQEMV